MIGEKQEAIDMIRAFFKISAPFLLAAVLVLSPNTAGAAMNALSDQRAWIGLDLFPTFLAADHQIHEKTGGDGRIHLLLVYKNRKDLAEEMASRLAQVQKIRNIPIKVTEIKIDDLEHAADGDAAGLFLVERMGKALDTAIRFGKDRHIILFSPFPGDVEDGVSAGMVISDRILPYVNVAAMRLSGIQIKSFFLNVAERYGE